MHVSSNAFGNGEAIPQKYTKDGQNVSPPISWTDVPDGAQELLLICDDPDAPSPEPFVHWVVYGLSPNREGIPEGGLDDGEVRLGVNSANQAAYMGPAPPPGDQPHHYHFRLYALDAKTDLPQGISRTELQEAMAGRVLAQSEIEGTYGRPRGRQ